MQRREFLRSVIVAGTGIVIAGGAHALPAGAATAPLSAATGEPYVPSASFPEGILSGDPLPDSVVLWTRIDPALAAGGSAPVGFVLGTDPALAPSSIVASGTADAVAEHDHCVRFDVSGLTPGGTWYYRFDCRGEQSPVGRTRTAPAPDAHVESARVAFFSCQRYTHGFWPSHRDLAGRHDVDLVVCLGDYVYNTGFADGVRVPGREDPVQDAVTLDDFRAKYHLYRSDLNLQAVHANFPFVAIFDNHDGGTDPRDPQFPGARAAFFEHMPIRPVSGDPNRQYRRLRWGDLAELFMLDERQYRTPEPQFWDRNSLVDPRTFSPSRTMLGAAQYDWLTDGLASTDARWKLLGNQVMFTPWRLFDFDEPWLRQWVPDLQRNAGVYLNDIQWDGYQFERRRLTQFLADNGVTDTMVLTGDAHIYWAAELQTNFDDPRTPYVLTEFLPSSVSSANGNEYLKDLVQTASLAQAFFPGQNRQTLRFVDTDAHGIGLATYTHAAATVEFLAPTTVLREDAPVRPIATFQVDSGTQRARRLS